MMGDEAQAQATAAEGEQSGRNSRRARIGAEPTSAATEGMGPEGAGLMDAVVERGNMRQALQRVTGNRGAPGVDGLTVAALREHLKQHWPQIKQRVLDGTYVPQPVRAVDIAKPAGGVRTLGIAAVVDRLIQQALLQVLQPIFDPTFSESSYGFRPGRSAQQAVRCAQAHVVGGRQGVVDIDLEKFFDRVNHDLLRGKVAKRVNDERVLKLIRRFLQAGLMREGGVQARGQGTPQGGPLSPLLSNILLDELDRELERRGHAFVRYADDCNVYVGSQAAGVALRDKLTVWLQRRLRLTVNAAKSAVARPWQRTFLGYTLTRRRTLSIATASVERLKQAVRQRFAATRGRSVGAVIEQLNPLLRGWIGYFRLTLHKRALEEVDGWVRRKLRCRTWRHGKRVYPRARQLQSRGLDTATAWKSAMNGRGPWWNAGASHMHRAYPKTWFDSAGLVSLLDTQRRLQFST